MCNVLDKNRFLLYNGINPLRKEVRHMSIRERWNMEKQLLQGMEREQGLVSRFLKVLALVSLEQGPLSIKG